MGGRYQAYPDYKNSGVEWLGDVPEHWDVVQIKHLSSVKRGASPRPIDDQKYFDDEGEYAWTRIADVTTSDVYLSQCPQTLSELGSSLSVKLEPGALFLSIAGSVGKPCITGIKACIHDGFVYFPELKIPNKYLYYVFAGGQAYLGLGKLGTQLNLNTDTVGAIKVGIADNTELSKIVDFLDHETAKIDTLIEKQQQLIALLKEKRQAVISHAVTKGLNPDAPMKDSGVEWLGEVPEHWKIMKFSYCSSIRNGQVDPTIEPYCNYTLIAPNHIESNTGRVIAIETAIDQGADSGKYLCQKGEVIYSKIRPALSKVCLSQSDQTICSADMYPIQGINGLTNTFLMWSLLSNWFTSLAILESDRVAMPKINREKLADVRIPVPPTDEQLAICQAIDEIISSIDKLLTKTNESINLAHERRTALISAAVTGKIDVRNWQPPTDKDIQ